jgi:hypothetical protein
MRESQHSPTIPVRYDKSLRRGKGGLSQKKTGGFVTGTNNALYEWTDSNGWVKLGGYLTPSLGCIAVVWYDRRKSSLATSDRACESCAIFMLIVLIFRHNPRKGESLNGRLQCGRLVKEQWARPDSNRRPSPCEGSFSKWESLLSFFLERSTIFTKKAIPSS